MRTAVKSNLPHPLPRRSCSRLGLILALASLAAGCTAVPVHQQRLVAKSGMTFDVSAVASPASLLLAQIEPGTAATAGAQAAGCTTCR